MSMILNDEKNVLVFDVPNSEASINAQHRGIVDRTVGSYYMSENYELCKTFLSDFNGEYYLDLLFSIRNVKAIIQAIEEKNNSDKFKEGLIPQKKAIEALEWYISKDENYYSIKSPTVNDNQKYLKLDNTDTVVELFRTLILGDLCSLNFKKIGKDGYIIYIDKNTNFNQIIETNIPSKWKD